MKTIETIQTVETTITRIPVKNLVISPLNVRKKQGAGIEELAALIASQGLIHNLVVTPQLKKWQPLNAFLAWSVPGEVRIQVLCKK